MSIEVEKTHFLTIDNRTIPISQLPDQIKEQVKVFDAIRQDLMDSTYKTNVFQLAAEQKKQQLEQLLQRYMQAEEQRKNGESGSEESGEPAPRPKKAAKKKTSKKRSAKEIEASDAPEGEESAD